ncbi:MAG: PDZ domain-containing protein [Gemmatirosa sp.]|nr:PDZ domain-containing protein [Gemmatirosa sp.]
MAVRAFAAAAPATGAHAQEAATPPAIACGFLLRAAPRVAGGMAADSVRRLDELPRLVTIQPGQAGGARERIRLERTRGWIGVQMTEMSETRVTSDGRWVRYCDYPVVVSVEPASPAAHAGLEAGDTVWAYNGVDLRSSGEVPLDRLMVPDDTVRFGVRRNGRALDLPVVVARRPDGPGSWGQPGPGRVGYSYVIVTPSPAPRAASAPGTPAPPNVPPAIRASDEARVRAALRRGAEAGLAPMAPLPPTVPMLLGLGSSALAGAQLVAMDDDLRAVVGTKRAGILVLRVAEGTPASEAGLRAGDVIVSANGRAVAAPAALQQVFLRDGDSRALQLRVERKGKGRDVTLRW